MEMDSAVFEVVVLIVLVKAIEVLDDDETVDEGDVVPVGSTVIENE